MHYRSLGIVTVILALIGLLGPGLRADTSFIRGDINDDGAVQISDVITLLDYLFGSDAPALRCADAADGNDDGAIQISDAIYLLAYLFTPGSPPPPDPFPACGFDRTGDPLECEGSPQACPDLQPLLLLWPMLGTDARDWVINNYVDLDTGAGVLDYLFIAFSGEGSSRSVSTDWVTLKGDTGTDKGELVLEIRGNGKISTY